MQLIGDAEIAARRIARSFHDARTLPGSVGTGNCVIAYDLDVFTDEAAGLYLRGTRLPVVSRRPSTAGSGFKPLAAHIG